MFINELEYYTFVLGYDLMHDEFENSDSPECDAVFERARKMAKKFINSDEYKDTHVSGYEALQRWLEHNKVPKITEEDVDKAIFRNLYKNQTLCDALRRCSWLVKDVTRIVNDDIENEIPFTEGSEEDIMIALGYDLNMLLDLAVTIIKREEVR